MSIEYRKQEKNVNVNGTTQKMYDAKIVYKGVKTLDEIEKEICNDCSLTEADVAGAVKALENALYNAISQGYIVDMGALGRFKPSFTSKAVKKASDVKKSDIKNVTCIYKPSVTTKKKLQQVELELNSDYDLKGNLVTRKHSKKQD